MCTEKWEHSCVEIWNAMNKKFRVENVGTKMHTASKFLNYKMVGDKSVISQLDE